MERDVAHIQEAMTCVLTPCMMSSRQETQLVLFEIVQQKSVSLKDIDANGSFQQQRSLK